MIHLEFAHFNDGKEQLMRLFVMKYVALFVSVALATVVMAGPVPASAGSDTGVGNGVTRWAARSLDAVRTQNVATPNAGRLNAMVTVAMYDAVNGIDRARSRGRTSREAARSRIFQGIHFQFSTEDGRRAGRGIGSDIVSSKLLPVGGHRRGSCA